MNYIVIGLGSFGSAIAINLTESGHEVMGVDKDITRIEALKERMTHAIALDATDQYAMGELPLNETDIVIVAIGEDIGANIMATAILKQLNAGTVVSRAISKVHQTVLEAMNVDIVINPEDEAAEIWAIKLATKGVHDVHYLSGPYYVIEMEVPKNMIGKTLGDLRLVQEYKVLVLTTFTPREAVNPIGATRKDYIINKIASHDTMLKENEIMVVYGNIKDIRKMRADF